MSKRRHKSGKDLKNNKELEELKRIEAIDRHIESDLDTLIKAALHLPTSVTIHQLSPQGDNMANIRGIDAGGNNSFDVTTSPAGSVFAAGTTFVWSIDDTADISLTPSADGLSVATACTTTPAATSANLTFTATPPTGPVVTATVNLTIIPAAPPVPVSVTINQLS